MYVGLFVKDKCERWVKNQASKDEPVEFTTSSQEVTQEKAMCGAHDWKLKSHASLSSSWVFREKAQPAKYPQNFPFSKKLFCFTKFFTDTINTLIIHKL